jgi:hypothetical protein
MRQRSRTGDRFSWQQSVVIFAVPEPMLRLRSSSEFINSPGVLNFQDNVIRRKWANEGVLLFFFSTNGLGPLAFCLEEKQCAETNSHVRLHGTYWVSYLKRLLFVHMSWLLLSNFRQTLIYSQERDWGHERVAEISFCCLCRYVIYMNTLPLTRLDVV